MAVEVRVPGVGESVQEGMIESWHKATGDWVEVDEVLLELETDKATVEVVAEAAGVLTIAVEAGTVVRVGDVIAQIDPSKEKSASKAKAAAPASDKPSEKAPPASVASAPAASAPAPASKQGSEAGGSKLDPGPAVRRMAAEEQVDTSQMSGSGRHGRVTKGDVINYIAGKGKEEGKAATPSQPSAKQAIESPVARGGSPRQENRKPMSMLRRRIAQRLLDAQKTAAILTTFNEVDMTAVMNMRQKYKDQFATKYGLKLGFMGFFLKASVAALEAYPSVNAYIEGSDLVFHNYCDIGVAVSTEKGLLVPVIRGVDKMSLAEIEQAIADFATKARDNKIAIDDLSGGTFTVSNGGVFGSLLSTPILNPPQSAILGMHKTQMRPVVLEDGKIEARPMMYLALSYDHRIIDGKEAVSFLVKIKDVIEDPSRLLLGV